MRPGALLVVCLLLAVVAEAKPPTRLERCLTWVAAVWRNAWDLPEPYVVRSGRHGNYDPETGLYHVRRDRREGDRSATRSRLRLDPNGEGNGGYFPDTGYVENDSAMRLSLLLQRGLDGRLNFFRYLEPGTYMFVVTRAGELIVGKRGARYPHPSLIGGKDPVVRAAGHFLIGPDGRLVMADNNTGHFGCEADTLDTVVSPLLRALPPELLSPAFRFERHVRDERGLPRTVIQPRPF